MTDIAPTHRLSRGLRLSLWLTASRVVTRVLIGLGRGQRKTSELEV